MTEYRHVGKVRRRKDGPGIVTGKALYTDDIKIPNALFVRVLHSPHPHANILSIDTSKAEALAGVKSVMTYKNAPDWKTCLPASRPVMDSHIRFAGDVVATVAAVSNDIAEEALALIDVEYELLPAVYDVEEAIKPGAPQLYRDEDNVEARGVRFHDNQLPPGSYFEPPGEPGFHFIREGDADKGLKESDVVIDGKLSYHISFPGAPETPTLAARWEDDTHVTLWASSQAPNMIVKPLGLAIGARVNAITPNVGGSYGNKDSISYTSMLVVAAAKVAGQAVRYSMTKEEHLLVYERRLSNTFIGSVGMNKDGLVHAIKGDWLINTGISSELTQGQVAEGLGEINLVLNNTPNWDFEAKVITSNVQPVGIARGFGGQELKACVLPLVARAMKKLDIDPVECLKKNFCKAGSEYYWRTGHKYSNPVINYDKCFDEGKKKFGWDQKWKGWGKPSRVEGSKAYGVGFSLHSSGDPQCDETFAYVRIENDQVIVHCAITECGNGQTHNLAKTAAEILNVPWEVVSMVPTDSLANPSDFGLAGSRGTIAGGAAVGRAALAAKEQLLKEAAEKMGCTPEELDTRDMMIFKKSKPEEAFHWSTICPMFYSITGTGGIEGDFNHNNCVMLFTEVEVDLDTGLVKLINALAASDVGQIVNPIELKMQFEGGLGSAGIDTAHLEGHVLDKHLGRTMTHNMIDYKWRPFNELPGYDTSILESRWPTANPFGAIGIGEITGASGPPSMMMAVENALSGVEINEYPLTPDVILKALGKV